MPKLYLVRHGKAAAGWNADPDPGLDTEGRAQAEAVAGRLHDLSGGPVPIISSPLKRCRQTALPLARRWNTDVSIEEAVAEIPSPMDDLEGRTVWLRRVMAGTWDALDKDPESEAHDYTAWRHDVANALMTVSDDTVVFTHFVAINAAVGIAEGKDEVVVFRPDNASVTIMEVASGRLRLIEKGREAETKVN